METQYLTVDQFADDSVEIEYIDEDTWTTETVLCSVPGSAAQKPKQVKLFGCVNRIQAMREGTFMAAKQEYRNRATVFKTELDGRNIRYLDKLIVAQDLHKWGQGGEVIAVDGQALTLSEPVDFDVSGTHQIYLRTDTGLSSGPYTASGASGDEVSIIEAMPAWVYTGDQKEKTYFIFVTPTNQPRQMLAQNMKANGDYEVTIEAVIDDPRVHSFDDLINNGTIIVPPAAQPRPYVPFVISNFYVTQIGVVGDTKLLLSWDPLNDAKRYVIEVSYDEGESWSRKDTVEVPHATISVLEGTVDVRIAPQNDETGQWYQRQIEVGATFAIPPTPTGLQLTEIFSGTAANFTWLSQSTAASWFIEVSDLSGSVRYQEAVTDIGFSYRHDQAALHGIGREFDVSLYAVNGNGVQSNPVTLRVKNEQTAAITGVVVSGFADQVKVDYDYPGEADHDSIRVYASQTQGFTPGAGNLIAQDIKSPTFSFPVLNGETWYVRLAGVDAWGDDELNFSAEITAESGEITATVIHDDFIETPMLKANAVTAEKVSVPNLSAISAVMGTVTSGIFKTSSLLGYRAEVSSEGDYPIWYGSGEKNATNGKFYFDKNGNLFVKGASIQDDSGNEIFSSGGAFSGSIPSTSVTGLGDLAAIDQITSANASTYIASAAIPRALIGSLNVDTADIQTAAVETLTVAGRAITHPVSAYTASQTSWTAGEETVQQVTINPYGGQPVAVTLAALIKTSQAFNQTFNVRCYRNATKILDIPITINGSSGDAVNSYMTFNVEDTPSAGSKTYYFKISGSSPNVSNRYIRVFETKR
jgi:hypothetical protein